MNSKTLSCLRDWSKECRKKGLPCQVITLAFGNLITSMFAWLQVPKLDKLIEKAPANFFRDRFSYDFYLSKNEEFNRTLLV